MILTDTGPLVALVNADDLHHSRCTAIIKTLRRGDALLTTWSCWTEALHLVDRAGGDNGRKELWGLFDLGTVLLHTPADNEASRCHELMEQYKTAPCDLADASLIAAAETIDTRRVFTIDGHFYAYRLADGSHFEVFPGPGR